MIFTIFVSYQFCNVPLNWLKAQDKVVGAEGGGGQKGENFSLNLSDHLFLLNIIPGYLKKRHTEEGETSDWRARKKSETFISSRSCLALVHRVVLSFRNGLHKIFCTISQSCKNVLRNRRDGARMVFAIGLS